MNFDRDLVDITLRLFLALLLGALVGIERTHRGRPAGFRTHALVALSTCMLMLVTVYESRWFPEFTNGRVALDPTRMAQGVMTGIGFLGAGAILREGFSVRGLTTAASIWITAVLGILVGIGFYFPALLGAALTIGTLAGFLWVEDLIPTPFYARIVARFTLAHAPTETELRKLLTDHGFTASTVEYRVNSKSETFEYRMLVRSRSTTAADQLAARLSEIPAIEEFRVTPSGE